MGVKTGVARGSAGSRHAGADEEAATTPSGEDAALGRGGRSDVLQFMQRLWAVTHAMQARSKRMRRRFGVTGPQRLAVRIIGREPGITAGRLADILQLHPSTLTGVLQRLEAKRLTYRASDPADGRRVLLHLTPEGRVVDSISAGTVEAGVRHVLSRLEPEKVAAAREVLGALAASLRR